MIFDGVNQILQRLDLLLLATLDVGLVDHYLLAADALQLKLVLRLELLILPLHVFDLIVNEFEVI